MTQEWFEMPEVRRRKLDQSVWIPLRAAQHIDRVGESGHLGFKEEFFGAGSVAVPEDQRETADSLDWEDIGLRRDHGPWARPDAYTPSDAIELNGDGVFGVALVLAQPGNSEEPQEWHLHQDLVIALRLKREGDVWVALDEGYAHVARIVRDGRAPVLLEIRAEYLKDYLRARDMALYVSSYRHRTEVVEDSSHINWPSDKREATETDRWEGRRTAIHEGGYPVGSSAAVIHLGRTDVYAGEDVPHVTPTDENLTSHSWTINRKGKELTRVDGEFWRNEWVNPGERSMRVRGDAPAQPIYFITDVSGNTATGETLQESGLWLWFRPDAIPLLAHRRGGSLQWYTRDTGAVRCSPATSAVHFGVNPLGLLNVYAKDIALLPPWQQHLWAGCNLTPEGGVAQELLQAQALGEPAETQAPEPFLPRAIEALNKVVLERFGIRVFRTHEQFDALITRAHRFRAIDMPGFLALAKDLARLTADSIDTVALHTVAPPTKGQKLGSLKSLELLVSQQTNAANARSLLGPLFGVYDLRLADAHLPSTDQKDALALVGVDEQMPFVTKEYQLLNSCVSALYSIENALSAVKST